MKLMLILLFTACSPSLFCQQKGEFKKFLSLHLVGKKQLDMDSDSSKIETTYIGKLEMQEGGFHSKFIMYHVLTQCTSVPAAMGKQGQSRLIFTDKEGLPIKIYTFNLPEELPTRIKNNGLTFGETTMRYFSLPDVFCVPNGACFE